MIRTLLLIASALVASSASAQMPGSCEVGTAQAFLEVSDVQASLFNNGALFFGGSTTSGDGYLVPKTSGNSPIFAAALWIGGKIDGEIRASQSRYGNRQMWPGPLNEDGILPNPSDCSAYDRIYTVSTFDVAIYEQTGVASSDLAEWPVGLGAPAIDASGQPVVVTSREQTLELANGERPIISGTQMAFWVMNDVGNEHTERNDARETVVVPPLGVEVAVTAFAVASEDAALNQSTFYQFTVTNRNTSSITNAYVGFYIDPDLGDAGDDYVGVDTTRGMAFVYNDSNQDAAYGIPPALGFDLLDGLGSFIRPLKSSTDPTREPITADEVYNRLEGLDNDGGAIREGGLGYEDFSDATGDITRFMFAGDPVADAFWSEGNLDGNSEDASSGDRLMTFGSPEFSLRPNESKTFALAVVFGQGADRLDSITELRAASDAVQAAYEAGTLSPTTGTPSILAMPTGLDPANGASFFLEPVILSWAEVPGATRYRVEQSLNPSFKDGRFRYVDSTSAYGGWRSPYNEPITSYWRVRAESPSRRGPFSAPRSVSSYSYTPAIRLFEDGSPAIVEVTGPGGIDPCGPQAQTKVGCEEIGAHRILDTPNSTGQFLLSSSESLVYGLIQNYAPHEVEIRMTGSSFVHNAFDGDETYEVPYEIWDIGMVRPGEPNDPSDDVRLIPLSYTRAEDHDACAFDFGRVTDSDGRVRRITDRIYAQYPTSTYEAYEAYVRPLVEADPAGCPVISTDSLNPFVQSQVFRRAVFEDLSADSSATIADLEGMVVRFYTNDPLLVANEQATPHAGGLTLGPAYPNPATSSLTVPYALPSAGEVELAVYDVLGRRVVELVDARQPEGAHTAELDARALAPGIYVVRLRAGDATRTTRITVVR